MPSRKRSVTVVCDASPLIFLAKVDRLKLLSQLFQNRCVVLECVAKEVLSPRADPVERQRLADWLQSAERIDYHGQIVESNALSRSDQSSLAWAVEHKADWLIADERLLRRFAKEHDISVMGFCGIIINASKKRHLSRKAARKVIDEAIGRHGLRLSITVYQAIMQQLA